MNARRSQLSRRRFLQGSAALAAGAGLGVAEAAGTAGATTWQQTVDVLVVGAGAAGSSAALTARRLGAKVLVIEKAPFAGGTSMKSVGGIWVPNNRFLREAGIDDRREDALRYMARLTYPEAYDAGHPTYGAPADGLALIGSYYDHAARVLDGWQDAGVLRLSNEFAPGTQMPDYYAHLPENKVPRGRALVPITPDGKVGNGAELIRQFRAALDAAGIPTRTGLRAQRLIMDAGRVAGLAASDGDGKTLNIRARRGVIFASGGFTHNPQMRRDFLKGPVFGGCAQPSCEGDFVTIAGEVGARLGNMSNAWWCQIPLDQALDNPSVPTGIWCTPGDSMLQVNRFGRRFLNEKFVYNERTQVQFQWDPVHAEYPNLLSIMIYDARSAREFAGYAPIPPLGPTPPHVHSADTLDALALQLAKHLEKIARHTGGVRLADDFLPQLKATVARFNDFARNGKDADFQRGQTPIEPFFHQFGPQPVLSNPHPNPTLHPLADRGPYHAVLLVAGTLDTKGGPCIDGNGRVLDVRNRPIAGLYGAGNCVASPTGPAYWAGGATLGPAITFGALAAEHAVRETRVDAGVRMSLPLGRFERFGMVVGNLEAAMQAYARVFGIRQFELCRIDGRPAALGGFGSLRLELIEGSAGGDVLGEFFDRRGEGMSHAVFVPDRDDALEQLAGQAAALGMGVEISGDRLTLASRAQLGGLALVAQSAPLPVRGRRSFRYQALLPTRKLFHLGMVVRDRELAIGNYQRLLGIDEFLRMDLHTDRGLRVWIDAQPALHHARTAFGRVGDFACELMEPLAGDGLYQRFLAAHGEGPQHYFPTILDPADFAAVRDGLARAGLAVRLEGAIDDALRYYYLDSTPLMGMCIEIIVAQRPDWWQSLGMNAQDAWRVGLQV